MKSMPTTYRNPADRRGFTLIEILVVLTIIIIIALAAIPSFRFITGARSIEGTQNIIASMVGRSRAQALADQQTRGVFFFVDPVNDRTTMALVGQVGGDFDQYYGWTGGTGVSAVAFADNPANATGQIQYWDGTGVQNQSQVITITDDSTDTPFVNYFGSAGTTYPRKFIRHFGCIQAHNPAVVNHTPTVAGNAYWQELSISLNFVQGTDFQILPQGVGVQLVNSNPTGVATFFDRYVRTGCVLFNRNGQFTCNAWSVKSASTLGKAMYLNADLDVKNGTAHALYSQFGFVLYDRQTFLAQTSSGGNFTEGDFIYPSSIYDNNAPPAPATSADEQAEETWLDSNSLPLLIDRHSGTLIKGE